MSPASQRPRLWARTSKAAARSSAKTDPAPDFDRHRSVARRESRHHGQGVGNITIEADDNLIDLVVVRAQGQTRSHPRSNGEQHPERQRHDHRPGQRANPRARRFERLEDHRRDDAHSRQIQHRGSSAAKIKAAVEAVSCTIETSSASKVEASVEAESCSLGRIERIENHPRRFRRTFRPT